MAVGCSVLVASMDGSEVIVGGASEVALPHLQLPARKSDPVSFVALCQNPSVKVAPV